MLLSKYLFLPILIKPFFFFSDFGIKIWDCNVQRPINELMHHSEFATGLDFNLFHEGQLASVGWDGVCAVFNMMEDREKIRQVRAQMDVGFGR